MAAVVGPSTGPTLCEVLACQFAIDAECCSGSVARGDDGQLNAFQNVAGRENTSDARGCKLIACDSAIAHQSTARLLGEAGLLPARSIEE
jgi:hypothetical protein